MFIVVFCLKFWGPDYLNTQENALDHLAPCSSSPHLTGARTGPARPRLCSTLLPLIWGRREPRALSGEVVKSHAETTRRTPGRSIIPIKPHRKSFKLSKGRRSGGGFFWETCGEFDTPLGCRPPREVEGMRTRLPRLCLLLLNPISCYDIVLLAKL